MIARYLIGAASALALSAAPAMAAPVTPASALSISKTVRTGTPSSRKKSNLAGAAIIPLALGAAIVAGGVYLIADDDSSDSN